MKARVLIMFGLIALVLVALSSAATPALATGNTWTVNSHLPNNSQCNTGGGYRCNTIQGAIDGAASGDTIKVMPGTYAENVTVSQSVSIVGAGRDVTTVYPAVSNPNPCANSSLCGTATAASNVFLIQANDVTISGLTVDGDNPNLTSTINVGGANIDARNGIISNYYAGVWNNLTLYGVTVKNIYLRGIYNSDGTGFNIHDNVVQNVQADASSIAIFNWAGSGVFKNNVVTLANDSISANHSRGTQFLNNTITHSSSGIHTDNAGDGGGAADVIIGNTITDCATNGYGIFDFVVYLAPTVEANRIEGCAVGLSSWGKGAAVTSQFIDNFVDGQNVADSTGGYVTTDMVGYGDSNNSVNFVGNTFVRNTTGFATQQKNGKTVSVTLRYNNISGNTTAGVDATDGGATVDAAYNWWGSDSGPGTPNNGVLGTVTTTPFAKALLSSETHSTHEIGETGSLDTSLTVNNLYGVQFVVDYVTSVLSWSSGTKTDSGTGPNDWIWAQTYLGKDFDDGFPAAGQTELAATLQNNLHPAVANLTDANIATWTYNCAAAGTSPLVYDNAQGTGTYLSDRNGFVIPSALTGDWITCVAATGSVNGTISLQGRLQGATTPAGWNGAVVTLTCADSVGGCAGYGPYSFTTDTNGDYALTKSGAGSGVVAGNYAVSVTRRAYLGATKTGTIIVAKDGTTTVPGPVPPLLGGDVDDSGNIDVNDLATVGTAFGQTPVGGADTGADVNGDDIVNIFDLVLAGGNFNLATSTWP